MHNVKKTPASEAQLTAHKKERDHKLAEFLAARDLIFSKREKNELDEELLTVIASVLKRNPDIYTFWNIRRDTITLLKERKPDETDEEYAARLRSLYDNELTVTFKGIEANPKSYSAWYHRAWTLEHHPQPDFKAELALCEKALSFDCRNFHCWDYRRVVARLAGLDDAEELAFSDRLIKHNPSNYSAWHYRGTMLQRQQQARDATRIIDEEFAIKELETVKNVCAYNCEDQTGWTYCRWLCEALCTKVEPPAVLVYASTPRTGEPLGTIVFELVFNQAISEDVARTFIDADENATLTLTKVSKLPTPDHRHSAARKWSIKADCTPPSVRIKLDHDGFFSLASGESFLNADFLRKFYSLGSKCESEGTRNALSGIVSMCEELMDVLAKESTEGRVEIPWHYLMLTQVLPLLNGYTMSTIDRSLTLLETLVQIDAQRRTVYEATSARLSKIREILVRSGAQGDSIPDDAASLYEFFKIIRCLD